MNWMEIDQDILQTGIAIRCHTSHELCSNYLLYVYTIAVAAVMLYYRLCVCLVVALSLAAVKIFAYSNIIIYCMKLPLLVDVVCCE